MCSSGGWSRRTSFSGLACAAIEATDTEVHVSVASAWEMAIKVGSGKWPEAEFLANRFEQEVIYYIEKIDITEEKVRLKAHIKYFSETLKSKDSNGKKLGFIIQEIGREINTIGSKANDAQIQKLVVDMKDELEKMKEQSANIL